jgi:hypothetical protein
MIKTSWDSARNFNVLGKSFFSWQSKIFNFFLGIWIELGWIILTFGSQKMAWHIFLMRLAFSNGFWQRIEVLEENENKVAAKFQL